MKIKPKNPSKLERKKAKALARGISQYWLYEDPPRKKSRLAQLGKANRLKGRKTLKEVS